MRPSPPPLLPPTAPLALDELVAIALARDTVSLRELYLSPRGRVPRRVFWLHGVVVMMMLEMLGVALMDIAGVRAELAGKLVNLVLAWPFIAISVKRLHDFDFRGWWLLLNFIPAVGSLVTFMASGIALVTLVACGFVPGTHGPNRFGPDPLARARAAATPPLSTAH